MRIASRDNLYRLRGSWWVYAIFAVVLGFGATQDGIRRLDSDAGWSLAGSWILVFAGVAVFLGCGYVAVVKLKTQRQ